MVQVVSELIPERLAVRLQTGPLSAPSSPTFYVDRSRNPQSAVKEKCMHQTIPLDALFFSFLLITFA